MEEAEVVIRAHNGRQFFYVLHDYGMGGLHYLIQANNIEEIKSKFPDPNVHVYVDPPEHSNEHIRLAHLAYTCSLSIEDVTGPDPYELCNLAMPSIIGWDVFQEEHYDPSKEWEGYIRI